MPELCERCGAKLTKDNERNIVVDITWFQNKYKTLRYRLCDDCSDKILEKIMEE